MKQNEVKEKTFPLGTKVLVHDVDGSSEAVIVGEPYEGFDGKMEMIEFVHFGKKIRFGVLVSIMESVTEKEARKKSELEFSKLAFRPCGFGSGMRL